MDSFTGAKLVIFILTMTATQTTGTQYVDQTCTTDGIQVNRRCGILRNEGFPNNSPFGNPQTCLWQFNRPHGTKIVFNITTVKLSCNDDHFLRIENADGGKILYKLDCHQMNGTYTVDDTGPEKVKVRFTKTEYEDNTTNKWRGFELTYENPPCTDVGRKQDGTQSVVVAVDKHVSAVLGLTLVMIILLIYIFWDKRHTIIGYIRRCRSKPCAEEPDVKIVQEDSVQPHTENPNVKIPPADSVKPHTVLEPIDLDDTYSYATNCGNAIPSKDEIYDSLYDSCDNNDNSGKLAIAKPNTGIKLPLPGEKGHAQDINVEDHKDKLETLKKGSDSIGMSKYMLSGPCSPEQDPGDDKRESNPKHLHASCEGNENQKEGLPSMQPAKKEPPKLLSMRRNQRDVYSSINTSNKNPGKPSIKLKPPPQTHPPNEKQSEGGSLAIDDKKSPNKQPPKNSVNITKPPVPASAPHVESLKQRPFKDSNVSPAKAPPIHTVNACAGFNRNPEVIIVKNDLYAGGD